MKRARRRAVREQQRAEVAHREELERRYRRVLEHDPGLAELVVAGGAAEEPLHRWVAYRQGFSPGLVRRFLRNARLPEGPVLDPFCGSGTVVIECARRGRSAVGIDVLRVLPFLVRARFGPPPAPVAGITADTPLETLWAAARDAGARAAVLLAVLGGYDGRGRPRSTAEGVAERTVKAAGLMAADLAHPPRARGLALQGDARALPLRDGSVAGILTSPPYLSRYDYERVHREAERLLAGGRTGRRPQVRASRSTTRRPAPEAPPAAEEAARLLDARDPGAARTVRSYFQDLAGFLQEALRVLAPGGPLWLVVGGADLKREYIPADLVLAEEAQRLGLRLEGILEARRLRPSGRHLGGLRGVSPRETLLELRRP